MVSTLPLLGVGAWRYATTGSQWLWLSVQIPSVAPALVAVAMAMEVEEKKMRTKALRRIAVTECWVSIPVLIAIALAVAACIVPKLREPALHGVQFPCHYLLSQLQIAVRKIRRRLYPYKQRSSESSENLFTRDRTEGQVLELESQMQSNSDADRDVAESKGGRKRGISTPESLP